MPGALTSVTNNTTTSSSTSASSAISKGYNLDMNAFLTLFLAQLKYQDPTNPMQSYELAAQLAQFSSVEQLNKVNSNLTQLQTSLASLGNAQMVDLIGKKVVGQASTLQIASGNVSSANYQLGASGTVTVKIYDANNNLVRTINVGSQDAGTYSVNWDGRNDSGTKLGDGTYTFKVEAVDAKSNALDVTTTVSGTVYSYRLDQGTAYLILNGAEGIKLPTSDVIEVLPSS